jgi:(2Fe-2S) ferredoxin
MGQYQKHVFVCTTGKECPLAGSVEVFKQLKAAAREAGITQTVRINQSGCTGQCGHGPMVVVYPENVWYGAVTPERATRIFDEHVVGGRAVEEFRYVAPPGENKLPKEPKE